MLDNTERWAVIAGFEDYAVSTHGRVKNVRYDSLLSPRANSYGKLRVVLYRNGERHDLYVHRLVSEAFMNAYQPHVRVQHRDKDGRNNNVHNLKFPEGYRMGHLVRNPARPVITRVKINETGEVFRTVEDCARYLGGDPSSIYRVLKGQRMTHKGFTFSLIEEEQ